MKIVLLTLVLVGCAGPGLTPEQLKSLEGQQMSICTMFPAWNGSQASQHYVSFGGKSTGTAGGGGEASCGASIAKFTNEGRAAKAASGVTP